MNVLYLSQIVLLTVINSQEWLRRLPLRIPAGLKPFYLSLTNDAVGEHLFEDGHPAQRPEKERVVFAGSFGFHVKRKIPKCVRWGP